MEPVRSQPVPRSAFDAASLRAVVVAFRDALNDHREAINNLNVYPVPDGDTGTNMSLTLRSVVEEFDATGPDMAGVCQAIAHGSLMGARGNSGVIMSQILRGFVGVAKEHDEVDGPVFAEALAAAAKGAYGAVGNPVEGTILVVGITTMSIHTFVRMQPRKAEPPVIFIGHILPILLLFESLWGENSVICLCVLPSIGTTALPM